MDRLALNPAIRHKAARALFLRRCCPAPVAKRAWHTRGLGASRRHGPLMSFATRAFSLLNHLYSRRGRTSLMLMASGANFPAARTVPHMLGGSLLAFMVMLLAWSALVDPRVRRNSPCIYTVAQELLSLTSIGFPRFKDRQPCADETAEPAAKPAQLSTSRWVPVVNPSWAFGLGASSRSNVLPPAFLPLVDSRRLSWRDGRCLR